MWWGSLEREEFRVVLSPNWPVGWIMVPFLWSSSHLEEKKTGAFGLVKFQVTMGHSVLGMLGC